MNPESSEQSSFGSSSQTPSTYEPPRPRDTVYQSTEGVPAEVLRLLSAQTSESSSTPRSLVASDTPTIDSSSTYNLPRVSNEFKNTPSLSIGDTVISRASSTPGTPNRVQPAVSLTEINKQLARRPIFEAQYVEYTYNADAQINISERHRRDGGILPSPGTRSHMHCPFKSLDGCGVMFDVREKRLWKLHSLDHFQDVKPPGNLACTFEDLSGPCREKFIAEDDKRFLNWNKKMEHLAKHYEDILNGLHLVFSDDTEPEMDANALSDVNHTPNKVFEQYIRRERRRLEDTTPPNRLPPSRGGARYREVVPETLQSPYPELHLDSGNATQYTVASQRRANRHEQIILR